MNVANQGFPAFRSDLNNALAALVSNSSGATAPTATFAHQFWVDTSANPSLLKQRNADNDAWVTIGSINQTTNIFNLAIAQGGTGAATAEDARIALGLVIGTDVQAYDADTAKTDVAQSFTAAQRGTITALTDGATITPDFAVANNFSVTLAGSRTLANPSNLTAGQSGVIVITQDGTGGRTLAFGSYWKFAAGTAPTLTTTAAAVDVLAYYVESGSRITARLIGDVK
jgi:hypothetical protein